MKNKTCCFTGHRELPTGRDRDDLAARLEESIVEQIGNGIQFFRAGGARGFDTLAAQTVLKLKQKHPDIKLILVLPCLTQTRNWPAGDVEEYERIKALADKVVYTSQQYTRGCMFKRDRHLVDNSSVCICYKTKDSGGTAYTVNYAKKQGIEVINIGNESALPPFHPGAQGGEIKFRKKNIFS